MKYFTKDHEWITIEGKIGTVGISDYAQNQLGDVVYVSLIKDIGTTVKEKEDVAEIESVKSVSPIFSPVDGKILEFNSKFKDESNSILINKDPYGEGWIFKLEISDLKQVESLLSESQYNDYIKEL